LSLNQKQIAQEMIDGGKTFEIPLDEKSFHRSGQILAALQAPLYLMMAMEGNYRGKLDQAHLLPVSTIPIEMKMYKKAEGVATSERSDEWTQVTNPEFKMGEMVKFEIEMNPGRELRDVAVEVPLPAGLNYIGLNRSDGGWYYRQEKRNDRVLYFFKYLPNQKFVLEIILQAQTPGVYSMPPISAQCMYRPEFFGSIFEKTVTIRR
jgi:uncharacterized protein YfaS (alpha-2-macroglobulin family)